MIVDDNSASIELLKWMIQKNFDAVTEIRTAINVKDALKVIATYNPHVLFLDIQMPDGTGFDVLKSLENYNFEVIFTTAFDSYAIQAIKLSALDYLLKPIEESEFIKAVERFHFKMQHTPSNENLYKNFMNNIATTNEKDFKLALPGVYDIQYVQITSIIRIQAESNYSRLYFEDEKTFLSSKTLKEYETILKKYNFIRVHKSHLINAKFILSYDKLGFIILKDKSKIEVSRRKKEYVLNSMKVIIN